MNGIPLQFIALFCIMFIALIAFNSFTARRRRQNEGVQSKRYPWYQQTSILTIIEYIVLALVFLLNIMISYHAIPANLDSLVFPLFVVLIFVSGLLAGYIIFLLFRHASLARASSQVAQLNATGTLQRTQGSQGSQALSTDGMSAEERTTYAQRRRDRRQKAATARRRKAGKA